MDGDVLARVKHSDMLICTKQSLLFPCQAKQMLGLEVRGLMGSFVQQFNLRVPGELR